MNIWLSEMRRHLVTRRATKTDNLQNTWTREDTITPESNTKIKMLPDIELFQASKVKENESEGRRAAEEVE